MRTSYVNVATPSASGRPPPGRQPTARRRASREAAPALPLGRVGLSSPVAATAAASPAFVPAPFVALKDARGAEASIPHLQSDHLPVFLYQTVVPVAGAEIKLVLPESEDLVVDMLNTALGRPGRRPALGDAVAGLGGARGRCCPTRRWCAASACWTSARASGSRA